MRRRIPSLTIQIGEASEPTQKSDASEPKSGEPSKPTRMNAWGVNVLVCAVAFAMLHVPGWIFRRGLDPSIGGAFLSICAFGMVAGFLAWQTPSSWAPILLHAANNFWSTGAFAWWLEQISG